MKTNKVISLILAAVSAAMVTGCGKKDMEQATDNSKQNVSVYTAQVSSIESTVTYTGEIRASESVSVISKLSAKAEHVYYKEGDYVTAGTVLARLDDTDVQLSLNQARAGYNSATAAYNMATNSTTKQAESGARQSYEAAKLAYENALAIFNREKQLYDNNISVIAAKNALTTAEKNYEDTQRLFDMGAASQYELNTARAGAENAKAAYDSAAAGAKAQLDAAEISLKNAQNSLSNAEENISLTKVSATESIATAKASVQTAQASLAIAENNVKNTVITAPISGYLSAVNINEGQMVSQGIEIFAVSNANYVDAEISVTESVIPYITEGSTARILVSSAGIETSGYVTIVNPVKNAHTGMYTVKVSIDNADSKINVGMFADVTLVTQYSENTTLISTDGIMIDGDDTYVYVVKDGIAEKRSIVTGIETPEYTEVLSGIEEGEQVVVEGKEYISETNNAVNITSEEGAE